LSTRRKIAVVGKKKKGNRRGGPKKGHSQAESVVWGKIHQGVPTEKEGFLQPKPSNKPKVHGQERKGRASFYRKKRKSKARGGEGRACVAKE